MSNKDKDKNKKDKRLLKEQKAKAKLEKRLAKIEKKKKQSGKVNVEKTKPEDWTETEKVEEAKPQEPEKDTWWSRFKEKHQFKKNLYDKKDLKAEKDKKEPHNYKLAFKEFPIKMVKEVSKIKWSSKKNLTYKFIQVVIFMVISACFFYLIDYIFQLIFTAAKVI